jgi:hypothetical protein
VLDTAHTATVAQDFDLAPRALSVLYAPLPQGLQTDRAGTTSRVAATPRAVPVFVESSCARRGTGDCHGTSKSHEDNAPGHRGNGDDDRHGSVGVRVVTTYDRSAHRTSSGMHQLCLSTPHLCHHLRRSATCGGTTIPRCGKNVSVLPTRWALRAQGCDGLLSAHRVTGKDRARSGALLQLGMVGARLCPNSPILVSSCFEIPLLLKASFDGVGAVALQPNKPCHSEVPARAQSPRAEQTVSSLRILCVHRCW